MIIVGATYHYIDISFLTLDRYAEGIMKILYADMDDKTAVEFVEK